MSGRHQKWATWRNLPDEWWKGFEWTASGRKLQCRTCGAKGYGSLSPHMPPDPHSWMLSCIAGHPTKCGTCGRRFTGGLALYSHQHCKVDHECCRQHFNAGDFEPSCP